MFLTLSEVLGDSQALEHVFTASLLKFVCVMVKQSTDLKTRRLDFNAVRKLADNGQYNQKGSRFFFFNHSDLDKKYLSFRVY